jgi:glucans biosynthesis protein
VLWQKDREVRPPVAWVRETRRGRGYMRNDDGSFELHVDFDGGALNRLPPNTPADVVAWIDPNGELLEKRSQRNEATGGYRLTVRFRRIDKAKPVELRAHLVRGKEVLSETWSYILPLDS